MEIFKHAQKLEEMALINLSMFIYFYFLWMRLKKKYLTKRRVYLAHNPRLQSITSGKSRQEPEAAGYAYSQEQRERGVGACMGAPSWVSLFSHSSGSLPRE